MVLLGLLIVSLLLSRVIRSLWQRGSVRQGMLVLLLLWRLRVMGSNRLLILLWQGMLVLRSRVLILRFLLLVLERGLWILLLLRSLGVMGLLRLNRHRVMLHLNRIRLGPREPGRLGKRVDRSIFVAGHGE